MSAAAAVFALLAVLFVDWGGDTSMSPLRSIASPLARWQVVPAVMAVSVVPLVALAALTLLFGRIYCSVLCPLGVLQDGVNVAAKVASKRAAMRFSYRKPRRWMRYGVLALTVILIAAGVGAAVALVDPYGIFGRIIYDGLRPLAQGCNNFLAAVAGDSFARETVSVSWVSAAIALIMLVIVVISAWRGGRAYCNLVLSRRDAFGRGVARIAAAHAYRYRPLRLVRRLRPQMQELVHRSQVAYDRCDALCRMLRLSGCVSPRCNILYARVGCRGWKRSSIDRRCVGCI